MPWLAQSSVGLIPAHAGKTADADLATLVCAAHPRSRGENKYNKSKNVRKAGSSPLTRGKRGEGSVGAESSGLIPAHAGKTRRLPPHPSRSTAHPRSRGENPMTREYLGAADGSSPLTRGKPSCGEQPPCRARLIPAHAGKTAVRGPSFSWCGAHPRSRGENRLVNPPGTPQVGSSPLTRGKQVRILIRSLRIRLIPAHAGKTRRGP